MDFDNGSSDDGSGKGGDARHLRLKRNYTTAEAQEYLGISRTMFEKRIRPRIAHKGMRAGVRKLFDVRDLDAAWDEFLEELEKAKEPTTWKKPARQASTGTTASTKSTKSFEVSEFDAAALEALKKRTDS